MAKKEIGSVKLFSLSFFPINAFLDELEKEESKCESFHLYMPQFSNLFSDPSFLFVTLKYFKNSTSYLEALNLQQCQGRTFEKIVRQNS